MVMQHRPVYPHDLFLGRERHVDHVELGQQPIRDHVPPTSRRAHRHQQLQLLDEHLRLLLPIVPIFFFFFRTTIKIIAKKRKNAPETVSYPLSNQFQRRLGTVDLFHRHVEVVHERDQNFTAHRHVNTLGPFLEPALHYVLKY